MRRSAPWVLIAALFAIPGHAGCRLTLQPVTVRELPREQSAAARSLAWRDEKRLLIGTRGNGIIEYDVTAGGGETLVGGEALPNGLADVEKLDTDGRTVVAFNRDRVDVAYDLHCGKLVHSRRVARRVYPEKQATEKVALDISDARAIGTHLRCDAWGNRLACITDEPRRILFDAANPRKICEK